MILGECPYEGCHGDVFLGCDDWKMPSFYKHECEECKNWIWTKITRVDPQSWTEEGFNEHFTINEETRSIKEKEGVDPELKAQGLDE